jgi:hypothetical protein
VWYQELTEKPQNMIAEVEAVGATAGAKDGHGGTDMVARGVL